jgi:hypothetical protein
VPITILRARPSVGCLFFGKIGGGRGLVRSHFFFPVKEKRRLRQEKSRAPVLPPVRRRFTSTKSDAIDAGARRGAGHRVQVPHRSEQFAGAGAAATLAMALKQLNWRRILRPTRAHPGSCALSASTVTAFRLVQRAPRLRKAAIATIPPQRA